MTSSSTPMRTHPRPSCPTCKADGELLYQQLRDGSFGAPGEWTAKKCRSPACGTVWLDPMPAPESLLLAYQHYYTHGHPEDSVTPWKRAYRQAVNALLILTGVAAARRRADDVMLGPATPGTLLDVGCGQGTFLNKMRAAGWTVAGIDFDPAAVQSAREKYNLDVRVGGIEQLSQETRRFDLITASHVIEHVVDPKDFLERCGRLLQSDGLLALRTPNANSAGHRRYLGHWRGLEPPRHLCVLTAPALRGLAWRAGLMVDQCFTSSAMAEGIWIASHFLRKRGTFSLNSLSSRDFLISRMLGPLLAIRAHIEWLFDNDSGDEICAVLKRAAPGDRSRHEERNVTYSRNEVSTYDSRQLLGDTPRE